MVTLKMVVVLKSVAPKKVSMIIKVMVRGVLITTNTTALIALVIRMTPRTLCLEEEVTWALQNIFKGKMNSFVTFCICNN